MKELARGWLVRVLFLIAPPFEFKLSVRLSAKEEERERERERERKGKPSSPRRIIVTRTISR